MDYIPLGRSSLTVSRICLGTMTFGGQNSEAEGHAQLDRALAAGINFIDTAEMYAVPVTAKPMARPSGSSATGCGGRTAAGSFWRPRRPAPAVRCRGFAVVLMALMQRICVPRSRTLLRRLQTDQK